MIQKTHVPINTNTDNDLIAMSKVERKQLLASQQNMTARNTAHVTHCPSQDACSLHHQKRLSCSAPRKQTASVRSHHDNKCWRATINTLQPTLTMIRKMHAHFITKRHGLLFPSQKVKNVHLLTARQDMLTRNHLHSSRQSLLYILSSRTKFAKTMGSCNFGNSTQCDQ